MGGLRGGRVEGVGGLRDGVQQSCQSQLTVASKIELTGL